MAFEFHDEQRALQNRFDTARLADRIGQMVKGTISDEDRAFIEDRDMFFMSSVDAQGHVTCSYKGGLPGFVRVVDEHTIAFPSYDGNGMYMSMGNVMQTSEVGLLFIDFSGQTRVRLNGLATIDPDDPLCAEYPEAEFVVRVTAREVFANCPRYIHKMELVEHSQFVPEVKAKTPSPSWKQMVKDNMGEATLRSDDPALRPDAEFAER
jgi:predicted pyridoxine 5'-phosphate oxidase superfamily flavin-nucleotide-binding protein